MSHQQIKYYKEQCDLIIFINLKVLTIYEIYFYDSRFTLFYNQKEIK